MVPILFDKSETAFTSNGIGRLVDCLSCKVTEERNGIYELEMTYPLTGKWFTELMQPDRVVAVIHDDNHDIQPFDVYKISAPIDGVVTINAHHISYRLNNIILKPYSATTAQAAVAGIVQNSVNANPFTFTTDKTVTAGFQVKRPKSVRSILYGQEGSLLDAFGTAEFKFDKFNVSMMLHRGQDTGVTVRYGKNMTAITQERDSSAVCSAVAPFWDDGENQVYLPEYIVGPTEAVSPVIPAPLDLTDRFEAKPTVAQLRARAKAYLDSNTPWIPSENIKVDFIALWQTLDRDEAALADLQKVSLCDTVSIFYTAMGIVAEKAKVVRVVYNVLAERFDELELGTVSRSYVAIDNGSSQSSGGVGQINSVLNATVLYPPGTYTESVACFGFLTGSKKLLRLFFSPSRGIPLDSSVQVSAIDQAYIRKSDGGYIIGSNADLSGYSPATARYGNAVRVTLTSATDFASLDEAPVTGTARVTFTIT